MVTEAHLMVGIFLGFEQGNLEMFYINTLEIIIKVILTSNKLVHMMLPWFAL